MSGQLALLEQKSKVLKSVAEEGSGAKKPQDKSEVAM